MAKLCSTLVVISCWLVVLACSPRFAGAAVQSHYERPTTNNGKYQQRVIVFVHGIFGDADDTWRYSPFVYWPRLLLKDAVFADSDIYVASYSTPYLGNTMTVDEVVANLNNRLVNDEVFSKHREVVFVCHSLGGLIVQRLLLTFRAYAQQVPFIYFFSTPETGAQIAKLGALFSSDPLLKAMFPGDENGYLQNLENEWRAARFPIRRFCAYEKKKYKGVLVVDRLSGTRNCDDPPIAINEDHSSIVKPNGIEHDSYIALRNAVKANPVSHSGKISRRRASAEVRRQPTNAQMEIIKEIEQLIISRDESTLRQAFGFPSMMETNIRMNIAIVRHFEQPDGKVLDLRPYLGAEWMLDSELAEGHVRRFGGGFQYDPPDGKRIYLLALPSEYSAGKKVLFKFENSTELPTSVVGAIQNLDDAVYENANQLLHVLNSALKKDPNYYLRYDDQTSPEYFHKVDAMWLDNFVQLRPKADGIRDAIRKYFQVE